MDHSHLGRTQPNSQHAQHPRGQLGFGIPEDLSACDPARPAAPSGGDCLTANFISFEPRAELLATASSWVHPYLQRALQSTWQSHRIAPR